MIGAMSEPQEQAHGRPDPREHPAMVAAQFQPGVSGNPGGRPKGSSILAPLLRKLAENENEHGEGARALALAEKAINGAESGEDITAVLKLMERTDPQVKESRVSVLGDSGRVPLEDPE